MIDHPLHAASALDGLECPGCALLAPVLVFYCPRHEPVYDPQIEVAGESEMFPDASALEILRGGDVDCVLRDREMGRSVGREFREAGSESTDREAALRHQLGHRVDAEAVVDGPATPLESLGDRTVVVSKSRTENDIE